MFSVPDIMVVSVLALLLFGPDRLPKLMRQAGRFMREVQNTSQGFISEMERAADLADQPGPPSSHNAAPAEPATYGDSAPHDIPGFHEPVPEASESPSEPAEPAAAAVNEHAEPSSNEHSALRNPPLGGSAI